MNELFMDEMCPLFGCLYNCEGGCEYKYASVKDPYSCACYDKECDTILAEEE